MATTTLQNPKSLVNDHKIQTLYGQAAKGQWSADLELDFSTPLTMKAEHREVWTELTGVFLTLEKMGLDVLSGMFSKAANKFHSEETLLYLTLQCADEARHVYAIENYMKALGTKPQYDWKYHVLGQAASLGFYRVENWLFSTLFSENFASAFLRRAKGAEIDPLGAELCRRLLVDESRHIHFLHIVLPDVLDRLSVFGRAYVKTSQYFIMNFTEKVSKTLADQAGRVGIDRRDLLEEVFENVEKAYEGFGVTRDFLRFPKLSGANLPSA